MTSIRRLGAVWGAVHCAVPIALAAGGPDLAVCGITNLGQYGRVGEIGSGTVGLAFGTSHYNTGTVGVLWTPAPSTNHPLFTQNLYRRSTVNGAVRFEQIGQSWVFNSYCPLQEGTCATCSPDSTCGPTLGPGCATSHSAGNNASPSNLSSRGFVNPFTGSYPSMLNGHAHSHTPISHRLQVDDADLSIPGAVYFAESHAVTHDDAMSGNQNNNVGYRQTSVTGPNASGFFGFALVGGTVSETPAIYAWTGATHVEVDPTPGTDGRLIVAYEVTALVSGGYRYEYAIYNMNNDAGVGGFSVPAGDCTSVSNVGFHAGKSHAAEPDAPSYSNAPWASSVGGGEVAWATESFAVNPSANAIRWGTMYNFRFDSQGPPTSAVAGINLFKTGGSTAVAVLGPGAPDALVADINGDCLADDADAMTLVNVLLGSDTNPAHMAAADLDESGAADGVDIGAFVAALMNP